ncbi:MAG: tyrosine-type recombinase/integrase [Planctomycetota bacterium]|jgi:integrase
MITKVGIYECPAKKNRWVVRWYGEYNPKTGKRRRYSKAFRLKRDAETFQAAKQAEFDKGSKRDKPEDITLGDFCDKFVATCLRNHSHSYRLSCSNTIGQLKEYFDPATPLRLIDRQQAEAFIASRVRIDARGKGKELSGWSLAHHLKRCRVLWRRAKLWGFVQENVFDMIKSPEMSTRPWYHLKPKDFLELLVVAPNTRWKAIYWVLYGCGLRFGEAFNLTWADIDFEHSRIHVRNRAATPNLPPFKVKADGRGAASKERVVPMPRPVVDALTQWQAEAPEGVPLVLLTAERFETVQKNWKRCQEGLPRIGGKNPRPWENRDMALNVQREIKRHIRRAGIKSSAPITVHTFRKSFGQNHADSGTPIHVLQQLMGHSSITTTREFYIRVSDANTQAAVARYEQLMVNGAQMPASLGKTDAKLTPAPIQE